MEIRKLTPEQFYLVFRTLRPKYFEDTLWYSHFNVRTEREMEAFDGLRAGVERLWELHLGLYDGEELIGWCSSHQVRTYELYMMNSMILPEYRRKGYYSMLLDETVKEAEKAGFQLVTSQHCSTNNPILVAKLKKGFKITGMEMNDEFGLLVKLTRFLNPTRGEVIEFRSGQQRPSEDIKKLLRI